jgi:hypothetical protein
MYRRCDHKIAIVLELLDTQPSTQPTAAITQRQQWQRRQQQQWECSAVADTATTSFTPLA